MGKPGDRSRVQRAMEPLATFGLMLVAAGLVAPLVSLDNTVLTVAFKWVFAVGAVIFTAARVAGCFGQNSGNEGFRVRRLRRMEVWAGIAFCLGAFFWFYNTSKIDSDVLTFRMLNETILFTMVGALIQIVSSWMLSSALRKEAKARQNNGEE